MNNKYIIFTIKLVKEIAQALEDGRITQEEITEFVLFLITEIPKLLKDEQNG